MGVFRVSAGPAASQGPQRDEHASCLGEAVSCVRSCGKNKRGSGIFSHESFVRPPDRIVDSKPPRFVRRTTPASAPKDLHSQSALFMAVRCEIPQPREARNATNMSRHVWSGGCHGQVRKWPEFGLRIGHSRVYGPARPGYLLPRTADARCPF
jgi:hypothetical protein